MWFDPLTSWIVALLSTGVNILSEKLTPTISTVQLANKDLQHKDRMLGIPESEITRNAEAGRYYIPNNPLDVAYPVPHRETEGPHRIKIENDELYHEDVEKYGSSQARQWINQGKYNLTERELAIAQLKHDKKMLNLYSLGSSADLDRYRPKIEEIESILASSSYDYRNTEAVQQWQKAHNAERSNH